MRYQGIEMTNAAVQGASPSYFKMGVTNIGEGRYFNDEENARHSNVVVIGRDVANTLFPFSTAVEQSITINGRAYRVVGVLAERDVVRGVLGEDLPERLPDPSRSPRTPVAP